MQTSWKTKSCVVCLSCVVHVYLSNPHQNIIIYYMSSNFTRAVTWENYISFILCMYYFSNMVEEVLVIFVYIHNWVLTTLLSQMCDRNWHDQLQVSVRCTVSLIMIQESVLLVCISAPVSEISHHVSWN